MALPSTPIEPEQGAVQKQEALEASAPPPIEPTPAQADEAVMQGVVQNAAVVQPGQQAVAEQQAAPAMQPGYTVKNPYTLMPARINFRGIGRQTPKSQVERNYDAGLLFEVLGRTSPAMRIISEELLGKTRKAK